MRVDLWIDDWDALASFFAQPELAGQQEYSSGGVCIRRWLFPWPEDAALLQSIARSDVVIEAFACSLPADLPSVFAESKRSPLWLNLEYLSAEDWVLECHGLPSLQSVTSEGRGPGTLRKYFFFPGFQEGTGGLLRERDLLAKHALWQAELTMNRRQYLAPFPLPHSLLDDPACLYVSLFSYEGLGTTSLLAAMVEATEPSLCLVPQGRSLRSVQTIFKLPATPSPGDILYRGALTLVVLPFSSQDEYDRLLSLCDFNIVRGEDSFVRAQWAAHPLLWHLYPQEGDAHLPKMEAFLSLYSGQTEAELILRDLWRRWNQGEDCRDLWHHLRPQLPALQRQARSWQQKLAEMPDLAANLLAFYREHRDDNAVEAVLHDQQAQT